MMNLKFISIAFLLKMIGCQDDKGLTRTNTYEKVVTSKTFVDKTLFIKLFFETKNLLYVTAPRGFGKSTNLMMLKTFCNLSVNSDGLPAHKNTSQGFKLFSEKQLAVYNETSFFNQHFGQYPVLHFQFRGLVLGNTSDDFIASFRDMLSNTCEEHSYLLHSSKLEKADKDQFNRLRTKSEEEHPSSLTFSGKTLTSLLYSHFKRSCVILIDDFDSLLPQIFTNDYIQNKNVVYILSFLRSFLAFMVKSNRFIVKALMTGCVRLLPPEIPTDATEIETVPYSRDGIIASFYGFTESEVTKMAKKVNKEKELEELRKWYCCYTADDSQIKLYNMYSISRYFQSGRMAPYWSDSGNVENLRHIFDYHYLGSIIDDSLFYNSVSIALPYVMCRFDTENVIRLKNTIKHRIIYDLREIHKNLFLKYIEDHGYFTVFRMSPAGYIYGRIPNREAKEKLEHYIYTASYYMMKFDIPIELIQAYTQSLENLNRNESSFKSFAKSVETIYDCLTGPVGEAEVLRILFTFANDSQKFNAVHKNILLGPEKKADLLIVTKKAESLECTGIIVEFNYGRNSAREALSRVTEKQSNIFETMFKDFPITTKVFIGLQLSREKKCSLCFLYNSTNTSDEGSVD